MIDGIRINKDGSTSIYVVYISIYLYILPSLFILVRVFYIYNKKINEVRKGIYLVYRNRVKFSMYKTKQNFI